MNAIKLKPVQTMIEALPIQKKTEQAWITSTLNAFDQFLIDHAAAEKKAAGMAISMISHYPDRSKLVEAMADLAIEEMSHYREVIKHLHARNLQLGADTKDEYVIAFRKHIRQGKEVYLQDRLLVASIIEARGAERFGLVALHIQDEKLQRFYKAIAQSEWRHYQLFYELADEYFDSQNNQNRFQELLQIEAEIIAQLPIQAALH